LSRHTGWQWCSAQLTLHIQFTELALDLIQRTSIGFDSKSWHWIWFKELALDLIQRAGIGSGQPKNNNFPFILTDWHSVLASRQLSISIEMDWP